MKHLILGFLLLSCYSLQAQTGKTTPRQIPVYTHIDNMPQSSVDITEYIKNNLVYPSISIKEMKQGKVIVQFVVTAEGNVEDVTLAKSVDPALDAEAIRVTKAMPKWEPAHLDGKAVDMQYALPIAFVLPKQ